MPSMNMKKSLLVASLLGAAFSSTAVADEAARVTSSGRRHNSLPGDPAVRHRRLLVSGRFEFAPLFESTINPEFQHIVGGGLKLEYHLGDMFSIGAIGVGSTQFNTKLTDR